MPEVRLSPKFQYQTLALVDWSIKITGSELSLYEVKVLVVKLAITAGSTITGLLAVS